MALFHDSAIVGASGNQGGAGEYQISRSLRFNSSDSAYLSRTPASAGNRQTWTVSLWVKRAALGSVQYLWEGGSPDGTTTRLALRFNSSDQLNILNLGVLRTTTQVFRDPSAWYHIVVAVDTPQATAANRLKIYVNGSQVTDFASSSDLSQNADTGWNMAAAHSIGRTHIDSGFYFNGYIADFHNIDGQALAPSSFAETNATTGQWVPKAYTGAYGTNGFRLAFADNSNNTATTLGKDTSGNGNNWTPNNLSVTAGAGNDSLVDTPTSYGTDTGAGGEVRGNYCTWNPLRNDQAATLSNGNLELSTAGSTNRNGTYTTIGVTTGKWYWEITAGSLSTDGYNIGIASSNKGLTDSLGSTAESYIYLSDGSKRSNGVSSSYGATYTAGDVIGVALDLDAASLTFYKNGASQGTAFTGIPVRYWFPTVSDDSGGGTSGSSVIANFGQRPFAYTAPSGFKALCTANLPAPVITKSSTVFDTVLWTGNGSARSITGLGFNPDLVWIKSRSAATAHELTDSVRGVTKSLSSNTTGAEATDSNGLTAFNSDGFSLGTDTNYNNNTATYAGWCWDAGSSTVTNTQGSITSQVRANASAGFSIVTYTGNSSSVVTIGHGLGVAPGFIIVKNRSLSSNWYCYHQSLGNNTRIALQSTDAAFVGTGLWNNTSPSSTVFTTVSDTTANNNGSNHVAYCFAPVAGYSAMGSYVGNGTPNRNFIFTGFVPKTILVKKTNASDTNWRIIVPKTAFLSPNTSDAEYAGLPGPITPLANGFEILGGGDINNSGDTYIYCAWAESPFQYARAR